MYICKMKGIKDFYRYEKMPFIIEHDFGKMPITRKVDATRHDTGEIVKMDSEEFSHFDKSPFIKVYPRGFQNISELNITGVRLLLYIMMVVGKKTVKVSVDTAECLSFMGIKSRTAMYSGIVSLLESDIIALAPGAMNFWINPNIFFNGSSVSAIEDQQENAPTEIASWRRDGKTFNNAQVLLETKTPIEPQDLTNDVF